MGTPKVTIAFISAERFEVEPFVGSWQDRSRISLNIPYVCVGEWRGHRAVAAAGGMGFRAAERATRAVVKQFRPDLILSIGLCGGLDPALALGEVVTASEVVCPEGQRRFRTDWPGDRPVTVVSQDRIAGDLDEKASLRSLGMVVEMEAAAVVQTANEAGLAAGCVKVVSDCADESFGLDWNAARGRDGGISTLRLAGQLLPAPLTGLRELWGLLRRSRMTAKGLGSYLASCRI